MSVLAELRWPILERIPIAGDFSISPHGITVALGFLIGAQVMLRRAERRGVARRHVDGVAEVVQSVVTRAAIGGILGARFFYVVTRLEQFPDPASWLAVWEGGLSLLGGIAGAVIGGLPYAWKHRFSVPLLLDSVAPGLALGIFVGRIGDLVIGEHLGGETSFFLGWRCTGSFNDPTAPLPFAGPSPGTVQGCFDAALHQTALYDFLLGGVIFGVLLLVERKPRFDGFFMAAFALLYGGGRFITDFARDADRDLVGTLTGSQLAAVAAIVVVVVWIAAFRPDRRRPYAWSPPDFAHPWDARSGDEPLIESGTETPESSASPPGQQGYPSSDGSG